MSYSSHKRANRATREHIARREHDVERGVWLGGDQSEASSCHRAKGLTRAYLVSVRSARAKLSSHQRPHGLRGASRTQVHNTSFARGAAKRTRECTLLQGPRHAPGRFDSIQGRMQADYLGERASARETSRHCGHEADMTGVHGHTPPAPRLRAVHLTHPGAGLRAHCKSPAATRPRQDADSAA